MNRNGKVIYIIYSIVVAILLALDAFIKDNIYFWTYSALIFFIWIIGKGIIEKKYLGEKEFINKVDKIFPLLYIIARFFLETIMIFA